MIWTFSNPKVAPADGNIDAVCIFGADSNDFNDYSGGGYCVGIKYVGTFSPVPQLWAIWATANEKKTFTQESGFSTSVNDLDNWRTDAATFTSVFRARRWMPPYDDPMPNAFRFEDNDVVSAYTYTNVSDQ